MEELLVRFQGDIIKTIKYLCAQNKANISNQADIENTDRNRQIGKVQQKFEYEIAGGVGKKRRMNEISMDSPCSDKQGSNDDDEEEKDEIDERDDRLSEEFSQYMISKLEKVGDKDTAKVLIQNHLKEFRYLNKKKHTSKNIKTFTKFIRKMTSDNSILKNAVRKLVGMKEETAKKLESYEQLVSENQKLKQELSRYEVALRSALQRNNIGCIDKSNYSNNDFHNGSGGVF